MHNILTSPLSHSSCFPLAGFSAAIQMAEAWVRLRQQGVVPPAEDAAVTHLIVCVGLCMFGPHHLAAISFRSGTKSEEQLDGSEACLKMTVI